MLFDWFFPKETRSLENPATPLSVSLTSGFTDTGLAITPHTALNIAAVWQAVNVLANDVAKLPLHIYRRTPDGGRERDTMHPASYLLRRKSNANLTSFALIKTMMLHTLLWGNAYAFILRDNAAKPLELILLLPERTKVIRINNEVRYQTKIGNETRVLRPEDVLHIRGLSHDGITGLSMIDLARESLALGLAAEKFGTKFFGNGSVSSGVITYPGRLKEQAANNLQSEFEEKHQGLTNAHRTILLQEGAKFTPLTIPPETAQFLGTREFQKSEVASWFNLPPHKVGTGDHTSYASLEVENQSYLDNSLDPWLLTFEFECFDKLLTEQEKQTESHFVEFVREALLRADLPTRYAAYTSAITNGFMSRNEVRRRENLPPIEGGDAFLTPLNMTAEPTQPPAPTTDVQRSLLVDVLGRMSRRIAATARQAAKQPADFEQRMQRELDDYEPLFMQAIAPAIGAIRCLSNDNTLAPGPIARRHVASLRDELKTNDIEATVSRWESSATEQANNILGIAL
ncbi:phage portal protein [Anatilimnocola floriformis]|uniref:phage portal protein n=1 Tax=Anatilimnocola floriformis TaxID=2948575 RepID=UPI0020C56CB0|nr:phage portal protein [Anatilimnocola floriformis]